MSVRNRRIVDAGQIRRNMEAIRAAVPDTAAIMAVVKADGYGHGGVTAARAALKGGATALAVATAEEGREIRDAGIREPEILVLGAVSEESAEAGAEADLTMTVCAPEMVRLCREASERLGKTVRGADGSGTGRSPFRNRCRAWGRTDRGLYPFQRRGRKPGGGTLLSGAV